MKTHGQGHVTFVGAGPGDPDLLTVKARKIIARADRVVYAGSLIPREILAFARSDAAIYDSAPLTLEETHALLRDGAASGQQVARLHTGDPSLYGALREQTELLDRDGISWSVVPGVTAAMAAAAAGGVSFTVPQGCQSLVFTRAPGRTPVPESMAALAQLGVNMAIYLSGERGAEVQEQLSAWLPPETPIVCAHRVGCPDEKVAWTQLRHLRILLEDAQWWRQTVILVLPALLGPAHRSCLYDANFHHAFRGAE